MSVPHTFRGNSSKVDPHTMNHLHPVVQRVTERIRRRSRERRRQYLERIRRAAAEGRHRSRLSCSNRAHGFAACGAADKRALVGDERPNIAIVTAYNDMLSAHQPFASFPERLRAALRQAGAVGQVAGGVPAMCDGITQGQPGMELSLFSRDLIAQSTAIALSHNVFDGVICLGVCDKIVPGLLIGALSFGHLPVIFAPAGPMPSGLPNHEKAKIRQLYAEGKVGKEELLRAESAAYHSPGTCTFYGTANSNQMLMEIMGLHLPGASFVAPETPLRHAFTDAAAQRVATLAQGPSPLRLGEMIDERSLVNALVGLLATGGSTNHTLHLVLIARAAGLLIDWQDFDELSAIVPSLTRIYPNGTADVNHFHRAGGMAFLIAQLLDGGLLHGDAGSVSEGGRLDDYRQEVWLGEQGWKRQEVTTSRQLDLLRPLTDPFRDNGGLKLLEGNLGRAVIKVSAVKAKHRRVEAPAVVFERQEDVARAFEDGTLDRDFVAVVRFQGPRANGMPELHKLLPRLGVLQDRGFNVALVTDGRLSGASGKVPSAIHVTPEAATEGPLAKLRDGDVILVDGERGILEAQVDRETWQNRPPASHDDSASQYNMGRELFRLQRQWASGAEEGASTLGI